MRLYQMQDKIIYGTVRQYHIWFINREVQDAIFHWTTNFLMV